MNKILFLSLLGILLPVSARAAVYSLTDSVVGVIPDGSSSGLVRSQTLSAGSETVVSVEVDLTISATTAGTAFLGDLYVYLSNGTDLAVLLNRPGRSATMPSGYSDNQVLSVTFSDAGAADIHNYRVPVTGSATTPLAGSLTGVWQPDARFIDPALVLDVTPRSAFLNTFNGDAASGTWTLFVSDQSTGATHELDSWTLRVVTIPEPGTPVMLLGLLGGLTLFRPRRRVM